MVGLLIFLGLFAILGFACSRADEMGRRRRIAGKLRDQLVKDIADVQTLAITSLKHSPDYMSRANGLLDTATAIVRSTHVDDKNSVHDLQGGIALVSQARAIVLGAGAK